MQEKVAKRNIKRPNLFIVGAPKCGTTAWVEYLHSHPEIQFSNEKEPHFFCEDFKNFRWARSLDEYHKFFNNIHDTTKIVAEGSVMYLYSKVAARNIHAYNPDARIIIFLRKYVDFLSSYHRQLLNILEEEEIDFSKAWSKQGMRRDGFEVPKTCREPKFLFYKDVASFGSQLERYYEVFPKRQIKVIWFDEWTKDPRGTYLSIMNFLGLNDDGREQFEKVNIAKNKRFYFLNKLVKRPPHLFLSISRVMKNIMGVKRLYVAQAINRLNEKVRPVDDMPPYLKQKIWDSMQEDLLKLETLTGKKLEEKWKP